MDPYHRGRSPSVGPSHNIKRSTSPSPNPAFNPQANAFGSDPSLLGPATNSSLGDALGPGQQQQFQQQQGFIPQQQYSIDQANVHFQSQPFAQTSSAQSFTYSTAPSHTQQAFATQFMNQGQISANTPFGTIDDPQSQFVGGGNDDLNPDFDSSLFLNLGDGQNGPAGNDGAKLYDNMSATHQRSPDAPHLLQPEMRQSIESGNQSSPSFYQDGFNSASHSRHASLSPSSAAYIQAPGGEYSGMAFQNHRRVPSEHSDVSSTHASPYLQNQDSFEGQPSPLLNGAPDPAIMGPESLALGQFSLSDGQHISPGHSSHPSPNLDPQQGLPLFSSGEGLGMLGVDDQFIGLQSTDGYSGPEVFPTFQQNDSFQEIGNASKTSPPEITFDLAPPSKQLSFNEANPQEMVGGALSPPDRAASRNRQRARSDPYSSAPSSRNNSPSRPRSPSDGGLRPTDNLSAHSRSRSTSPSAPPGGIQKSYRRESSPAIPSTAAAMERSRMLERAHPPYNERDPSPAPSNVSNDGAIATGPKRAQKHPATFQCDLCPKRFTRAYNLRSHLRTHTDERPFVCTHCGKAFARQHDRKRHEGLHSGEKKFVCRGTLATPNAGHWGCGRKFARADALGRHFRSEAGRSCIKPLLDEEARQKGLNVMGQPNQGMMQGDGMGNPGYAQNMMPMQPATASADFNGMVLPAVLLEQYPALAGIAWDAPPNGSGENSNMGDYEGSDYGGTSDYGEAGGDFNDFSGRTSFEGFEDDEGAGYKSDAGYGPTLNPSFGQGGGAWQMPNGGASMNGYYSDRGQ